MAPWPARDGWCYLSGPWGPGRVGRRFAPAKETQLVDVALVEQACTGDPVALDALLAWLRPIALSLARNRLSEPDLVEDAVQEALLALTTNIRRLRRPAAVERVFAWLVANQCRALRRREARQRQARRQEDLTPAYNQTSSWEATRSWLARQQVQSAVEGLPAAQQATARLFLADYGVTEIAALLGVGESTAKKRIHDARTALGRRLGGRAATLADDIGGTPYTAAGLGHVVGDRSDDAVLRVRATVGVGAHPAAVLTDPATGRVLVVSERVGSAQGRLTALHGVTLAAVGGVPLRRRPQQAAIDPVGRRVYVTHYSERCLSVLDADSLSVVAEQALEGNPVSVAVDPHRQLVYVALFADAAQAGRVSGVAILDGASGRPRVVYPLGDQRPSPVGHAVARHDPAADRAAVVHRSHLALFAGTDLVVHRPLGVAAAVDLALLDHGQRFAISPYPAREVLLGDVASGQIDQAVRLGTQPRGLAYHALADALCVGHCSGDLTIVRGRSGHVQRIPVARAVPSCVGFPGGLCFSADGRDLLASNQTASLLYALALAPAARRTEHPRGCGSAARQTTAC